ncbi:hypothetical protein GGTG_02651 [Gaeumannomyces tritici R3-111a-1]|uniref:Uncharacterized protein n=1 Tax=Gaeumannomyces tritici (strain R3-111a-1) TaxID=644352 RepID=J3NMZ3_GAET3|nr:hypothetical protein GGTG_02651 [Gaeumannomyces tritici R3-111a-1]EJT77545.1 hypothetical protein GGTG_02651 [Gaeumannomyces tritici R3-111a-1]
MHNQAPRLTRLFQNWPGFRLAWPTDKKSKKTLIRSERVSGMGMMLLNLRVGKHRTGTPYTPAEAILNLTPQFAPPQRRCATRRSTLSYTLAACGWLENSYKESPHLAAFSWGPVEVAEVCVRCTEEGKRYFRDVDKQEVTLDDSAIFLAFRHPKTGKIMKALMESTQASSAHTGPETCKTGAETADVD